MLKMAGQKGDPHTTLNERSARLDALSIQWAREEQPTRPTWPQETLVALLLALIIRLICC